MGGGIITLIRANKISNVLIARPLLKSQQRLPITRAYHLQGRCTDIQNSYILNAVISVRPAASRDIFAFVAVYRLSPITNLTDSYRTRQARFLCRSTNSVELTTCPTKTQWFLTDF